MGVTNYYSAGGELYGESTNGVMTTYMSDALGSTIGTFQAGAVVNSYVYSPYGKVISKTGTAADPRFLWNGKTQSRTTGYAYAEQYNWYRHYSSLCALWTSADVLWPDEAAYAYVDGAPVTWSDPSGLQRRHRRKPRFPGASGRTTASPAPPTKLPKSGSPTQPSCPPTPRPIPPFLAPPWWWLYGLRALGVVGLLAVSASAGGDTLGLRKCRCVTRSTIQIRIRSIAQELYDEVKRLQDRTRPCSGNFGQEGHWIELAQLRLQYIEECDDPGGGGRKPNPEGHALAACLSIAQAILCEEFKDKAEFPNDDFSEWIEWCMEQAAFSSVGWKFPTIFQ